MDINIDGAEGVWVKVRNYNKFKGRDDVKTHWWARVSNTITEDPDFYEFTHEEFKVWIHIICVSSKQKSAKVFLHFVELDRKAMLSKSSVVSAIQKLEQKRMLTEVAFGSRTGHERIRADHERIQPGSGRISPTTLHDITIQDRGYKPDEQVAGDRSPLDLVQEQYVLDAQKPDPTSKDRSVDSLLALWATFCPILPQVAKMTDKRRRVALAQLRKYPDLDGHWATVLRKWAASDFCQTKWRPNFDDLLREDKRIATLEGKYDNRATQHVDDFDGDARKVLEAVQRISPDKWVTEAPEFLGPRLWDALVASGISIAHVRQAPSNDFTLKKIADRLKSARHNTNPKGDAC